MMMMMMMNMIELQWMLHMRMQHYVQFGPMINRMI